MHSNDLPLLSLILIEMINAYPHPHLSTHAILIINPHDL